MKSDQPRIRAEIAHVEHLLSTRALHHLKFNQPVLELSYRQYYREHINQILRQNLIINLSLSIGYVVFGAFIIPMAAIYQWVGLYFVVCFSSLLTLFVARIRKTTKIEYYIAFSAFFSIVFLLYSVKFTPPEMHPLIMLSVLLVCFSCYSSTLLPFKIAVTVCTLSLVLGLGLLLLSGTAFNLYAFIFALSAGNLVGTSICYLNEYLMRKSFLQRYLMALEKRQLRSLSRQFETQSLNDALTNIPNRRHFNINYKLEWMRCLKNAQPLSLIFIDIDHYKKFNDFYGHQNGDNCLKNIAQSLELLLIRPQDMISRYGGEEFIMLLPRTDVFFAIQTATKIQNQILKLNIPHATSPIANHVTLSMGIASMIPTQDDHLSYLIDMADKALYKAKSNGRNQWVVFDSESEDNSSNQAKRLAKRKHNTNQNISPELTLPLIKEEAKPMEVIKGFRKSRKLPRQLFNHHSKTQKRNGELRKKSSLEKLKPMKSDPITLHLKNTKHQKMEYQ